MGSGRARAVIRDAIVITTIVGGLFVAIEGAIRVFWPQNLRTDYLEGGSAAIVDDQLGHRLRPLARATVSGPEFAVELRTNAEGLRDEVPHPLPKPPDTTRILVLGDSFTYGSASAYDEIWPVLFERRLLSEGHRIDVVKAGVPGYDTRTEALYLERIFADYDPDIVLLTFLPNDLFTNTPIGPSRADLEQHESPIVGASSKGSDLHSLILLKRLLMANDWLYARLYIMTKRAEYFATPLSETLRRQIEVTKELLERVHRFCRRKGRELVVLSIPQQFQVLAPDGAEELGVDVDAIDRDFAAFARERGFAWLPVLPTLNERYRTGGEDLFHRFDGHLNQRGNRVVADYLVEVFIERFVDPSRRPPAADPSGSV
jgi:lysophospholipase L1-like esterase